MRRSSIAAEQVAEAAEGRARRRRSGGGLSENDFILAAKIDAILVAVKGKT